MRWCSIDGVQCLLLLLCLFSVLIGLGLSCELRSFIGIIYWSVFWSFHVSVQFHYEVLTRNRFSFVNLINIQILEWDSSLSRGTFARLITQWFNAFKCFYLVSFSCSKARL